MVGNKSRVAECFLPVKHLVPSFFLSLRPDLTSSLLAEDKAEWRVCAYRHEHLELEKAYKRLQNASM